MEDKTTIGESQPQGISDALRQFIEALAEEVVLEGKPFDTQKKWLRRYSEAEGVDYEELEKSITALFEALEELKSHESKSVERLVKMLGEDCYLSVEAVDKLVATVKGVRNVREEAERKAKEEAERKAREESARKAKEETERKAREEAARKAKEEAERKAREEAARKAKEEAERKAREEAERKAKEEAERKAREEAARKAKEEAERKAREAAARKAKEEAERKAREEAARKAKEEAERKAREAAARKAKEEAERMAREEAARKAKEEAERKAREAAARKAKEEAERKAREEAARKAKEEAERMARINADDSSHFILVEGGSFYWKGEGFDLCQFPEQIAFVPSFHISKYVVTQEQWINVMGNYSAKGSVYESRLGDRCPAIVKWDDAQQFIFKLYQFTGIKYRIPFESEWDFAAIGGRKTLKYKYSGSNDYETVAWKSSDCCPPLLHEVGLKRPNELGLYDMCGNVEEWCSIGGSLPGIRGMLKGFAGFDDGGVLVDELGNNCPGFKSIWAREFGVDDTMASFRLCY